MLLRKIIIRITILSSIAVASLFLYNHGNAHSYQTEPSVALIFDLGGVLVDTDIVRTCWHLGPRSLMRYWQESKTGIQALKKKFFKILNKITDSLGNRHGVKDEDGNLIPLLFCDWLAGMKTNEEINTLFIEALNNNPKWCKSANEHTLLTRLSSLVFNPKLFANTRKLHPEGISFVKECKERGYKMYILSNWDSESFEQLVHRFPDFFSLFDGFIISGYVKNVKPNKTIYEYFTKQGTNWVLIDDQKENIHAAKKIGIHGIHCKKKPHLLRTKPNFIEVRKKLYQLEKEINNNSYATLSNT